MNIGIGWPTCCRHPLIGFSQYPADSDYRFKNRLCPSAHTEQLAVSYKMFNTCCCQLAQGVLVEVTPSLVIRRKTHFHNLPCGASIILGNNGYIWIHTTSGDEETTDGGFVQCLEVSGSRGGGGLILNRNIHCVESVVLSLFFLPFPTFNFVCTEISFS